MDTALLSAAMNAARCDTLAAFAALLDVDERTLRRWRAGHTTPLGPARQLCRLIIMHPNLAVDLRLRTDR